MLPDLLWSWCPEGQVVDGLAITLTLAQLARAQRRLEARLADLPPDVSRAIDSAAAELDALTPADNFDGPEIG